MDIVYGEDILPKHILMLRLTTCKIVGKGWLKAMRNGGSLLMLCTTVKKYDGLFCSQCLGTEIDDDDLLFLLV